MILALALAGTLFFGAIIILLVTIHLKRRWYSIAKKETAKDSPMSYTNVEQNTNTIVMEEVLQEFGHSRAKGNTSR